MPEFVNIAAYQFVPLDRLTERKEALLSLTSQLQLKGTILLSREGINIFVAGQRQSIDSLLADLKGWPELASLDVKESFSDYQPFNRMLVRLKKEIISMGVPEIRPVARTSPKISATELKLWLDEGRDIALLDVRNDYEIELGTFENAIPIGVDHFRKFPAATRQLPASLRDKPVVMFCTGGIRCEKAGPLMENQGFSQVYQLDGGILKYFEECGGAHYQGDCFVFDKRVALDPQLTETDHKICFVCQRVLSIEDQRSEWFEPGKYCPHCNPNALPLGQRLAQREAAMLQATTPLPGSIPYVNHRPMSVTAKFDNRPLLDFLLSVHPKLDANFWDQACQQQRVRYQDRPLALEENIRAGWRIYHCVPNTIEPDVDNGVKFLFEDDDLIAIAKPAPLPMHPCGRFNKNTLQNFLRASYPHETLRILHRLDADTTGVLLLGRSRAAAVAIQRQFANGGIRKKYLALVQGHPAWQEMNCRAKISEKSTGPGGVRKIIVDGEEGLSAATDFHVIRRNADGSTLLACHPVTGRTNQIRIHLAYLGFPIIGESGYASLVSNAEANRADYGNGSDEGPISETENQIKIKNEIKNENENETIVQPLHLHASELEFVHPDGRAMRMVAPTPKWGQCEI